MICALISALGFVSDLLRTQFDEDYNTVLTDARVDCRLSKVFRKSGHSKTVMWFKFILANTNWASVTKMQPKTNLLVIYILLTGFF